MKSMPQMYYEIYQMYQGKCMKACTLHLFFLHCKLFKYKKNKQTNQNKHMQNIILFPYK